MANGRKTMQKITTEKEKDNQIKKEAAASILLYIAFFHVVFP